MKQIKITCLLLFVFSVLGISSFVRQASALPLFNPFNFHYYEVIQGEYDWNQARILSEGMMLFGASGHLATLTSSNENQWVWENMNHPTRYLLGATDRDIEGVWQWVTGEQWDYTTWNIGEPNDGFGNYPEDALSYWDNGHWNDLPMLADYWGDGNPYIFGFIVEWDFAQVIPEPATMTLLSFGVLGLGMVRFLRKK